MLYSFSCNLLFCSKISSFSCSILLIFSPWDCFYCSLSLSCSIFSIHSGFFGNLLFYFKIPSLNCSILLILSLLACFYCSSSLSCSILSIHSGFSCNLLLTAFNCWISDYRRRLAAWSCWMVSDSYCFSSTWSNCCSSATISLCLSWWFSLLNISIS